MIDGDGLICLGLAGSLASAGLWPLITWLVERGYVDVIASTSRQRDRGPARAAGRALLPGRSRARGRRGAVAAGLLPLLRPRGRAPSSTTRWRTSRAASSRTWPTRWPRADDARRALHARVRALARRRRASAASIAATCFRHRVPLFVPAAPDGPLAEGYRTARAKGPVVDFFARLRDRAAASWRATCRPGRAPRPIFLGGGVPKDFIQITATSVKAIRGDAEPSPHLAAIQITTDNTVFGGLGGAWWRASASPGARRRRTAPTSCCFADVTIALPLLCQGLPERYGPGHARRARAAIHADLASCWRAEAQRPRRRPSSQSAVPAAAPKSSASFAPKSTRTLRGLDAPGEQHAHGAVGDLPRRRPRRRRPRTARARPRRARRRTAAEAVQRPRRPPRPPRPPPAVTSTSWPRASTMPPWVTSIVLALDTERAALADLDLARVHGPRAALLDRHRARHHVPGPAPQLARPVGVLLAHRGSLPLLQPPGYHPTVTNDLRAVATVSVDNAARARDRVALRAGRHHGIHRHEYAYVIVPMTTGRLAATGPAGDSVNRAGGGAAVLPAGRRGARHPQRQRVRVRVHRDRAQGRVTGPRGRRSTARCGTPRALRRRPAADRSGPRRAGGSPGCPRP